MNQGSVDGLILVNMEYNIYEFEIALWSSISLKGWVFEISFSAFYVKITALDFLIALSINYFVV